MPRDMVTVTVKFCAAHRLVGHQGKCRHLHGHNYKAEIAITAQELNPLGMVVDFAHVKEPLKNWVDAHWDHNTILHPEDPLVRLMDTELPSLDLAGAVVAAAGDRPFYRMPVDLPNPTAENMAAVLAAQAALVVAGVPGGDKIKVLNVRLFETDDCWADYYCGPTGEDIVRTNQELVAATMKCRAELNSALATFAPRQPN